MSQIHFSHGDAIVRALESSALVHAISDNLYNSLYSKILKRLSLHEPTIQLDDKFIASQTQRIIRRYGALLRVSSKAASASIFRESEQERY